MLAKGTTGAKAWKQKGVVHPEGIRYRGDRKLDCGAEKNRRYMGKDLLNHFKELSFYPENIGSN